MAHATRLHSTLQYLFGDPLVPARISPPHCSQITATKSVYAFSAASSHRDPALCLLAHDSVVPAPDSLASRRKLQKPLAHPVLVEP